MRLEINDWEKNVKNTNTWRLNNTVLNNQEITEEIKDKIKNTYRQMTMKTQRSKTYRMQQKQFKEESLELYMPTSKNKKKLK